MYFKKCQELTNPRYCSFYYPLLWCCWFFGRYSHSTYINENNKKVKLKVSREKIVKNKEATLIVKANLVNQIYLPSGVVAAYVLCYCCCFGIYLYRPHLSDNKTTIKQKVSREKTEQNYRKYTHYKDGINGSNSLTFWCCCGWCYIFGTVSDTTEIVWKK